MESTTHEQTHTGQESTNTSKQPQPPQQTFQVPKLKKLEIEENQSANIDKLKSYLNKFMKVEITDGRIFIGRFNAIDNSGNLLLGETTEIRIRKDSKTTSTTTTTSKDSKSNENNNNNETLRSVGSILIKGKDIVKCYLEDGNKE